MRQLALPSTVTDAMRPYIRNLLDQVEGPLVTAGTDEWWVDLLPADVVLIDTDADLIDGATVVSVNRLRGLLPLSWIAASGASIVYAEAAAHHPRPLTRARFSSIDVTGVLWAAGLSTVDVHRPMIDCPDGKWELAIGRARPTPPQILPS